MAQIVKPYNKMARPDLPVISVATEASLIMVSSGCDWPAGLGQQPNCCGSGSNPAVTVGDGQAQSWLAADRVGASRRSIVNL